jgi:dynein heavy chain
VNLFDERNKEHLPILKMELVYDEEEKMQFYPAYEDLEELILFVMNEVTRTMQAVPTIQSWLAGGQQTVNVDVQVADHILQAATNKLKEAAKRNFEDPELHLKWFSKCHCVLLFSSVLM